jgi:hypothetical protein
VASAAVRSFHCRSRPGTSISARNEVARAIGSPLSTRAASVDMRWKRAPSSFFCSPRPTTSTRVAATPDRPNSTWLLPSLPLMSPESTRRLIAPPEASSMSAAALVSIFSS